MAKKNRTQRKQKTEEVSELVLPQNIMIMGEQVPENKRIYILQSVYKEIHRFTKDKTENESGGILLGNVVEEFGKTHIIIRGFIEAKHCEGTPTTLKFTHETWDYIHRESARRFPNYKIVGWIHTHPNFDIFLSEYDMFIQKNFFHAENQIAYVIDPIQHKEGFFYWINESVEQCKGFYVFDKTGVNITVESESNKEIEERALSNNKAVFKDAVLVGLIICLIALLVFCFSLNSKIRSLQSQQATLIENVSHDITALSSTINSLKSRITALETDVSTLQSELDQLKDLPTSDGLDNDREVIPSVSYNDNSKNVGDGTQPESTDNPKNE